MESEDHLDKEISVSAELTETGVKASTRSRAASAVDRLCGSIVDIGNAYLEAAAARKREKTKGEIALIRGAAKYGVEKMAHDPAFAQRAFEQHYDKVVNAQANKDAVVQEALRDLDFDAVDSEEENGPDQLSDVFLSRFEHYAEEASTEELRQLWGRVLAGEVRKPGTFSRKVLRAVDELDSRTAALFKELSQFSLDGAILRPIAREITYTEKIDLFTGGLITDASDDQIRYFYETSLNNGTEIWLFPLGTCAIAFPRDSDVQYKNLKVLRKDNNKPCIPIHLLSDVGRALLSILPRDERLIVRNLFSAVSAELPEGVVQYFWRDGKSNMWISIPEI